MSELRLDVPEELLDEIAERAAVIVLARLAEREPPTEFLSVGEAADFLRTSKQRIYDLLSDGSLTRYKDGARVLVSRVELVRRVTHGLPARSRSQSRNGVAR